MEHGFSADVGDADVVSVGDDDGCDETSLAVGAGVFFAVGAGVSGAVGGGAT